MSAAIKVEQDIVPKASCVMPNCVCTCLFPSHSLVAAFSSGCAVPRTQVEASWLHCELPSDPAHHEHLSQPRQSPSLPGILRETHRSVESKLCVKERAKKQWNLGGLEESLFASEHFNIFL